ncbi:MAG: lipocalin family protein [Pseudomonadota bacterium]
MTSRFCATSLLTLSAIISGCASAPPPIKTAEQVDLSRFMGDWYVIANIPTFIEKQAYNAVESYALADDGTIDTTFSFNKGGFDGKRKVYRPTGFIRDAESNAVWGMQFIWPFKAEYRVLHIDDDYEQTIIGRTKRDFVWIMARTPEISADDYFRHIKFLRDQGYDTSKVKPVPQNWAAAKTND